MPKTARFFHRQFQHLLRRRCKWHLTDQRRSARRGNRILDRLAYLLQIQPEINEHRNGDPLPLANQPQEKVFGANVVVLQTAGFLAREKHDLPHPFGELVVHNRSQSVGRRCPGSADGMYPPSALSAKGGTLSIWVRITTNESRPVFPELNATSGDHAPRRQVRDRRSIVDGQAVPAERFRSKPEDRFLPAAPG